MISLGKISVSNFRSIEKQSVSFGENKTVFVGKNGSGKTNILYALAKVFEYKHNQISKKDFRDSSLPITITLEIRNGDNIDEIHLVAHLKNKVIKTKLLDPKHLLKWSSFVYIPADRYVDKKQKQNWYNKLMKIILDNKMLAAETGVKKKELRKITGWDESTLVIRMLQLYLASIAAIWDDNRLKIFIVDQPENYLHPHATKLIDRLLQQIGELNDTQILYSTHSTDLVSNFRKWKYEIHDIVFTRKSQWVSIYKKIHNKYGKYNKIMISLIFKNASLFFSDAVILTEWETERISIPNIYENWKWTKQDIVSCNKNCNPKEYFNLDLKNISIIDVWWKWSLWDWYCFAAEIFWPENTFAMIDKDPSYENDEIMIKRSIRRVHKKSVKASQFKKYNWIVLDGEFENYYEVTAIYKFLVNTIISRTQRKKWKTTIRWKDIDKLESYIDEIKHSDKISVAYEHLFNKYFKKYWKPTIAFNLSTWLCKNKWYKPELIKILKDIVISVDKK